VDSLAYRLKEFLPGADRRTLVLDTSAGLWLGVLSGLEDFGMAVRPLLSQLDGLVCSPGQIRRLENRTRKEAALLVRVDWTNALRSSSFPLHPETTSYISILDAKDALELGASAMVISFLLGYEEEIEAGCLKNTVQLALTGKEFGLPLVVEVLPLGPRISLPGKAVELGASYALEGGADVVVLPYPGRDSLTIISAMLSVPWMLKPTSAETAEGEWGEAQSLGATGLWLDHSWLKSVHRLEQISEQVHKTQ